MNLDGVEYSLFISPEPRNIKKAAAEGEGNCGGQAQK